MPEKEIKEVKTFTEDEVNENYVPRAAHEAILKQNEDLVRALNKLLNEYNELHLKALINNYHEKKQ